MLVASIMKLLSPAILRNTGFLQYKLHRQDQGTFHAVLDEAICMMSILLTVNSVAFDGVASWIAAGGMVKLLACLTNPISTSPSYHIAIGCIPEKTTKGDNWCYAGEVEEDNRSHALEVEAIFDVTPIHGVTSLDVTPHTTKRPEKYHILVLFPSFLFVRSLCAWLFGNERT